MLFGSDDILCLYYKYHITYLKLSLIYRQTHSNYVHKVECLSTGFVLACWLLIYLCLANPAVCVIVIHAQPSCVYVPETLHIENCE